MNHYHALKKMMPIDLGEVSDKDMQIKGALLDAAYSTILLLIAEYFPSTVNTSIEKWTHEYGLIPRAGDTLEHRRRALCASYTESGSLSKPFFERMAERLGYQVTLSGGVCDVFRASISRIGDPVGSTITGWTTTVKIISISHNAVSKKTLEEALNDLYPPHMRLIFEYP